MNSITEKALCVFPEALKMPISSALKMAPTVFEIRLICDKSVYLWTAHGIRFVTVTGGFSFVSDENTLIPTQRQLEEITDRAIGFSGFSHENELKQGFITMPGAIRLGICSRTFTKGFGHGQITSVSVRLPFTGDLRVSAEIDKLLSDFNGGILIAGAPGCGKTTLLRYISRQLSDGITGDYRKVTVIDERNELAGVNDLGACTDVIGGKPKAASILHAVRLLSPHYVVCDEIGNTNETQAILEGLNSGVSFIASMHAGSLEELYRKKQFRLLFEENVFQNVVLLSEETPGCIKRIYRNGELNNEICSNSRTLHFT